MPRLENGSQKSDNEYIYGIDLIRFVAAVSVAAFHLTWKEPDTAWYMPFGWVGVQVFFVISGLVIANSASGSSARQFAEGRFLRLYPAAWCAALISFPLVLYVSIGHGQAFGAAQCQLLLKKLLASCLLVRGNGPFLATAYWTLPIELSFYFLIYLMIYFGGFKNIQRLSIILILWGAPYLLALAMNYMGFAHLPWIEFAYSWKNMSLLRHGPYFGLGILIWMYKVKRVGKVDVIFMGTAILLGMVEIYARAAELAPKFATAAKMPQINPIYLALASGVVFCAAFSAIMISVTLNHRFSKNASVRKAVRQLGLMTYPLYLLHETVGGFVLGQLNRLGVIHLASLLIALTCVSAVSFIVAAYGEPALRNSLKRMIDPTKSAPLAAE